MCCIQRVQRSLKIPVLYYWYSLFVASIATIIVSIATNKYYFRRSWLVVHEKMITLWYSIDLSMFTLTFSWKHEITNHWHAYYMYLICVNVLVYYFQKRMPHHLQHRVGNHGNNTIEEFVLEKEAIGIFWRCMILSSMHLSKERSVIVSHISSVDY